MEPRPQYGLQRFTNIVSGGGVTELVAAPGPNKRIVLCKLEFSLTFGTNGQVGQAEITIEDSFPTIIKRWTMIGNGPPAIVNDDQLFLGPNEPVNMGVNDVNPGTDVWVNGGYWVWDPALALQTGFLWG